MRTVLAIVVCLLTAVKVSAQDRYFLAIQTEDRQPFYVRVANKTWSSTSAGHLVVPSLGDSTYQLSVGFPQNRFPEQNYLVTFNRKDLGFTLKQGGDQGWALVSWDNGEKIQPGAPQPADKIWYGERKKDNAFANLMAAVVNDSAVLYVASVRDLPGKQEVFANAAPAPKAEQDNRVVVKTDSAAHSMGASVDSLLTVQSVTDTARTAALNASAVVVDSAVVRVDSAYASPITTSTSIDTAQIAGTGTNTGPILVYTAPKPGVSMVKDHILPKGRNMVFTDSSASGVDTISVIIDAEPDTAMEQVAEKKLFKQEDTVVAKTVSPAPDTAMSVNNPAAGSPEPVKTLPAATETTAVKNEAAAEDKKKLVLINSDCANFATDSDIDKLRVKIMDEPTIDSKIAATKKLFKSKCIYTRQIKALSELFPNDEGKYKFFEHCYPFTADTAEFRSLLSLLSEDAYIARFKTLVRIKD